MSLLRSLSVVLAIAAAFSIVLGSAGVSGVTAERGVQVSVVDDQHAYIGFDAHQINPNKVTIKIANRYFYDLEVMVSAESTVTKIVAVGKEKSFSVEVQCVDNETSFQQVVVTASRLSPNEDFASLERSLEIPPCADSQNEADGSASESDS